MLTGLGLGLLLLIRGCTSLLLLLLWCLLLLCAWWEFFILRYVELWRFTLVGCLEVALWVMWGLADGCEVFDCGVLDLSFGLMFLYCVVGFFVGFVLCLLVKMDFA